MEFESWELASFDLLSTILSICAGTFHRAGAMFASPGYLWFLLNKYTNNSLNKQIYRQKIIRSCSKPDMTGTGEAQSGLHWLSLRSQTPGITEREAIAESPLEGTGKGLQYLFSDRGSWANTSAWSQGRSLFCWLTLIKRDQKWDLKDLNWFLSVAFLVSTAQCPLQRCQDLRMWGHKADFKPEEQNKLLGLGRWKRTLLFSAV